MSHPRLLRVVIHPSLPVPHGSSAPFHPESSHTIKPNLSSWLPREIKTHQGAQQRWVATAFLGPTQFPKMPAQVFPAANLRVFANEGTILLHAASFAKGAPDARSRRAICAAQVENKNKAELLPALVSVEWGVQVQALSRQDDIEVTHQTRRHALPTTLGPWISDPLMSGLIIAFCFGLGLISIIAAISITVFQRQRCRAILVAAYTKHEPKNIR